MCVSHLLVGILDGSPATWFIRTKQVSERQSSDVVSTSRYGNFTVFTIFTTPTGERGQGGKMVSIAYYLVAIMANLTSETSYQLASDAPGHHAVPYRTGIHVRMFVFSNRPLAPPPENGGMHAKGLDEEVNSRTVNAPLSAHPRGPRHDVCIPHASRPPGDIPHPRGICAGAAFTQVGKRSLGKG